MNELVIKVEQKDGVITFNNFELLKEKITKALESYKGLELTDDNKQELKKMRTELNNTSKLLNRERIDRKKEYLKPYDVFENQIKELDSLVVDTVAEIDKQIKEAEEAERIEKREILEMFFNARNKHDFITFDDVGLNITISASDTKLQEEIERYLTQVDNDLLVINNMNNTERLLAKYIINKNLAIAINELNKELELENQVKEPKETQEGDLMEATFTVRGTKEQLIAVRNFLIKEGIGYE